MISHLNVYIIHNNRSKDLEEIRKNYYICYNKQSLRIMAQYLTVDYVDKLIERIALGERPQSFGEKIANSVSHGVIAHKRKWG